jgi:5'-phosphate synthase pdxT subunit
MILLATEAIGAKKGGQKLLSILNVTVHRNAFGGQVDSFVAPLHVQGFETPFEGVFIRAPIIEKIGIFNGLII